MRTLQNSAHQVLGIAENDICLSAAKLYFAYGLANPPGDVERTAAAFAAARDRLSKGLAAEGYAVLPAEGTYFLSLDLTASGISADDVTFCERAVREAGIAAIPVSAFYAEAPVTSVVRLCFAKQDETLQAGIERLGRARMLFG